MTGKTEPPMVQCADCQSIVLGTLVDGAVVPTVEACPDCGGDEFVKRFTPD